MTLKDRPGELSKLTKFLTSKDINIETLYLLNKQEGSTDVAMIVDKMDEAKIELRKLASQ